MTSNIPYDIHYADYYVDGFPIFEHAETKFLGTEEGYIEVQFVWGIAREKYLSLFEGYLNQIPFDGINVVESQWVNEWRIENVVYATGAKYKYLQYISAESENDAYLVDGVPTEKAAPPYPWSENIKEMTMHPFVPFNNIIDLIISGGYIETQVTVLSIDRQDLLSITEGTASLRVGMLLKEFGGSGDIADSDIRIAEIVSSTVIRFNQDVYELGDPSDTIIFISTKIDPDLFIPLKSKLTDMGLILGGNKGSKMFEHTISYLTFLTALTNNGRVPLTNYVGSFTSEATGDRIWLSPYVEGNQNDEIVITLDLEITQSGVLSLYSVYDEEVLIQAIPYTDAGGGYFVYDTEIRFKPERNVSYFIKSNFPSTEGGIPSGGLIKISQNVTTAMYSMTEVEDEPAGHYNCILNLPEMTPAEFLQQMLIISGLSIGWDANGDIRFFDLQNFAGNIASSDIVDWSGRVSTPIKGEFQFNSNAQLNVIKYSNSDKLKYIGEDYLTVFDNTIDKRRELYTLAFDLPEGSPYNPEFILYKQRVQRIEEAGVVYTTFTNTHTEKPSVAVYDVSGVAKGYGVAPNDFFAQRTGLYRVCV